MHDLLEGASTRRGSTINYEWVTLSMAEEDRMDFDKMSSRGLPK